MPGKVTHLPLLLLLLLLLLSLLLLLPLPLLSLLLLLLLPLLLLLFLLPLLLLLTLLVLLLLCGAQRKQRVCRQVPRSRKLHFVRKRLQPSSICMLRTLRHASRHGSGSRAPAGHTWNRL